MEKDMSKTEATERPETIYLPLVVFDHESDGKHDGHIVAEPNGDGLFSKWHRVCASAEEMGRDHDQLAAIVRAVNAHGPLVAALEDICDGLREMTESDDADAGLLAATMREAITLIDAAIQKARGA
jgi:hypothetical protein